jgi:hypothetical protein
VHVELGALIHKAHTELVLEGLANHPSVVVAFVAGGRSNDLFEYREFGDYGEASIVTVIADESASDEILGLLHSVCGLDSSREGVVFAGKPLVRTSVAEAS